MRTRTRSHSLGLGAVAAAGLLSLSAGLQTDPSLPQAGPGVPTQALTLDEVNRIIVQAVKTAERESSLLRRDGDGATLPTRMQIAIVDTNGKLLKAHTMEWAWIGSQAIAQAKAYTAVAFSSHNNALSTRSVGNLPQPGGPRWNIGNFNAARPKETPGIIEFPGGLPLYKNGQLVGAIGISGDGVEQDENVAEAGAKGFEPLEAIRIDRATSGAVPYTE